MRILITEMVGASSCLLKKSEYSPLPPLILFKILRLLKNLHIHFVSLYRGISKFIQQQNQPNLQG
jgi:hypothetical protein